MSNNSIKFKHWDINSVDIDNYKKSVLGTEEEQLDMFEEHLLGLLQKEIDDKNVAPLDLDLIYRMKIIQEKGKEAELRNKLLYGEWKMEPVELLVLYSKGNKRDMQAIYGKENVHYVNTKYSDIKDIVQGHRYKQVIVVDDSVEQEDIDIAEGYKVGGCC